jgi:uncharacterized protein (DUF1810 family)
MTAGALDRFLAAQDSRDDGYAAALDEIRAGAKRGHWIWYVFPQLAGLGSSAASRRFGIADPDEAAAYLRHPILRARLREITDAVTEQLRRGAPLPLLMGSEIDARKLVSSLTLFGEIANRLVAEGDTDLMEFGRLADETLDLAGRYGYERCPFTERHLFGGGR